MGLITTVLLASALMPQANSDIQVPFRIGQTAIIVDAEVNKKPVSLMFDTGFSGSVLVDTSINLGKPTGSMTLRDFVGELSAPTTKLTSLKLGNKAINIGGMEAVQMPDAGSSFAYGQHVDGIMGFQVIKDEITEINFQKNMFIFHPRSLDISKRKPDNKTTFLAKLLPIGANSMEMEVVHPNGKSMTLALDTGNSFYATTHKDVLERIGVWDSGREPKFTSLAGVASGAVTSFNYRFPKLSIFGVPVENSTWDVIDLPSSSAEGDGTVGFGFLKNFNIIIDYDRRYIWLENFTGKVANVEAGETGISATYSDRANGVVVVRVSPDTPAALAGIKEGDQILSIDGIDLNREGYQKVRTMLEGEPGSKVKLAIKRGGSLKRFEIERKSLVNE
jgi:hypothetical protein